MPSGSQEPNLDRGPNLAVEQELLEHGYAGVVGMDEVGRGALAGPVTVGATWVPPGLALAVEGLTDSKALSPVRRRNMVPKILDWVVAATGSSTPQEIDELGITQALRLAGMRAMDQLCSRVGRSTILASAVLLDGRDDWLTRAGDLLSALEPDPLARHRSENDVWDLPVTMQVKGDFRCASISAASVVAKVERDDVMVELSEDHPMYAWDRNKGYGSSSHRDGILRYGPCAEHRLSWSLGASEAQIRAALRTREVQRGT
ncbi:ribonuclease HII [Kocuria sp. HSID16901]|uniref:ribonuclease HII n=1 Tax=Kocuria sp. HSID16901 TaxID=2419505 RepID=UPI00066002D8|nr:ribonuclease HII [Kocuria sp. HSID16901]RUQ22472.1 ribonuclease HII [Kocuria sp. HSID16901]